MSEIFKKHLLSVIIALLIGVIVALPHLWGQINFGSGYFPLRINAQVQYIWDETYAYAAQTHQLVAGFFRGDSYYWENRDKPSPFLGEAASIFPIAVLTIITGSVPTAFIISDFVFPVILFLLIFYWAKKQKLTPLVAISLATASIIIPYLSSLLPFISKEETTITGALQDPLFLSRTPHPQISLIYLFAALFATSLILEKPKNIKLIYLWSVVIGISFHSSLFVSSTVLLGTIITLPQILKKIKIKILIKPLLTIGLIGLPLLLNTLEARQSQVLGNDFLLRTTYEQNILFPRQIRYIALAFLLLIIKKDQFSKVFLAYVFSAALISDGHQLLLGFNIDADHWLNRVMAPLSTFALILIIHHFIHNRKLVTIFWPIIIILLLSIGTFKQISWIRANINQFAVDSNLQILIADVNKKTDKDDVIGSISSQLNQHLTGLTGRRVYLGAADRVISPIDEQVRRACDLLVLSKNQKKEKTDELLIYAVGYLAWNRADQDQLRAKMSNCLAKQAPPKYKIDYFIEQEPSSGQLRLLRVH